MSARKIEPRYLTKSRFKIALECRSKLFYTNKKEEYYDRKIHDDFLKALAKGGFQVGELAKQYFPTGTNVGELDYDKSLEKTGELLKLQDVIIYEAAFKFGNLFVRTDIVEKKGNQLHLYEVKAKSVDSGEERFIKKDGEILAEWKPFFYDVAFQKYVLTRGWPEYKIKSHLMFVDKSKIATVDGLNQCFRITEDQDKRVKIVVKNSLSPKELGNRLLTSFPVDEIIDPILSASVFKDYPEKSFIDWIHFFESKYKRDEFIRDDLGARCGKCEFQGLPNQKIELKIGFKECWKNQAGFNETDFDRASILKLWNFRKKDEFIKAKKFFQSDLKLDDLEPSTKSKSLGGKTLGMTHIDRQTLQIKKSAGKENSVYLDTENLRTIFKSWNFPLHFIDFETTNVAIPFHAGMRPYELIAFQFSHHTVDKRGIIDHAGQWFNSEIGAFPNFDFVRALKMELGKDAGTIFRYSTHENTVLNAIHKQLENSKEKDKDELCSWIEEITYRKETKITPRKQGHRSMVDLHDLALRFYFDPATHGSNSLKSILLGLLKSSLHLRKKYSKPIYGQEIRSLNFKEPVAWFVEKNGEPIDPYDLLPKIFEGRDITIDLLDELMLDEEAGVQDGGAAMIAYAQMQFAEMSNAERALVREALLKYCELDTLAMVMLWEDWNHQIFQ